MAEPAKLLARAIVHFQDEQLDEAEAALAPVLEREPRHADALDVLRHEQGRNDEVVELEGVVVARKAAA